MNPMFGIFLTLSTFLLGARLYKNWPIPIFTPLAFSIFSIIILLLTLNIDYETFQIGGQFIDLFITPATVALAIVLERNFHYLKENLFAIITGITLGVILHTMMILFFVLIFQFDHTLFATLYPKSITTAIAVGVSESANGIAALTVTLVVLTGIFGAIIGPSLFRWFKVKHPVAQGIALGTGAHAMGTSKAIQLGDVQGAMAGLAIIVTGITVVVLAPIAIYIANFFL
jgi:putative effector of murein hydrolase